MVCSNIIGISSLSHSGQKESAGEKDPRRLSAFPQKGFAGGTLVEGIDWAAWTNKRAPSQNLPLFA
jgi:hypothetical protein